MSEYPKIETLFDRAEDFKVIEGRLRLPEFGLVNLWHLTEKIDGTNVRIAFDGTEVRFYGRTDNAQMPTTLLAYLQETFPVSSLAAAFPSLDSQVWLYGEGYGPKIQSGGNYADSVRVRLFDVRVGDWWLNWEDVEDVANKLGVQTVPVINRAVILNQVVPIVRYLSSEVAHQEADRAYPAEGVVARTNPLLFTRRGDRLMFKLKAKDLRPVGEQG